MSIDNIITPEIKLTAQDVSYIDIKDNLVDAETQNGKREKIQQEALRAVLLYDKSGLHISMGVGKTYIGIQYLEILRQFAELKVLVVAPKVSIFDSWKNDLEKFNYTHLSESITYSTYLSINKHNPKTFNVVILDEAHNCKENHEPFLEAFTGRILGLTGTPPRYTNTEKGRIMQKYYPIRYTYSVDEAVSNKILNDYRINIIGIDLDRNLNLKVETKNKHFYTSEQKQYDWVTSEIQRLSIDMGPSAQKNLFYRRINRINYLKQFQSKLKFCKNAIDNLIPKDEKCLIFANTIEQADELCSHSYHSKNPKDINKDVLEKFNSGEVTRISAVEQLSEGITIKDLKHIIILHSYGNEKRASQKIGRALRLSLGQTATVTILYYVETVDFAWVQSALEDFEDTKMHWYKYSKSTNKITKDNPLN
jgi:superfamily II DNA or RNA helicase